MPGVAEVWILKVIWSVEAKLLKVPSARLAPVPWTVAVITPLVAPAIVLRLEWLVAVSSSITTAAPALVINSTPAAFNNTPPVSESAWAFVSASVSFME